MSKVAKKQETDKSLPVKNGQADEVSFAESETQNAFAELRRLLFTPEQEQLTELQNKLGELQNQLNNLPPVQKEEVSDVLPDAVIHRSSIDSQLSDATLPIVEQNIRDSVKRNPQTLAEALFPVIGPAIRKAIAEALSSMVQSLNQTLEHSFSPQGLKWRLEAMQTGKSFAEVVLLKTLLYRVEQVFLIHQETGLLLKQASWQKTETDEDADMVSAMLTAIQDFVHDSFKTSANATLDSLQVNELAVWIERSPNLILAAVIRGNAPLNLREVFEQSLEEIEALQKTDLDEFQGENSAFEKSRPILEGCLRYQTGKEIEHKKRVFTPFNVLAGGLALIVMLVGFFFVRDYWRWSNYLSRLKNEPGIVVTETQRGWFTHSIQGLRDDLAVNPQEILSNYGFEENDVEQRWEVYQSSHSDILNRRLKNLLNPPESVSFAVNNGVLTINGTASGKWILQTAKLSTAVAGIKDFRLSPETLNDLKRKIEEKKIGFICKTTDFVEKSVIAELSEELEVVWLSSPQTAVEIEGSSDEKGTPESNLQISNLRAEKVLSELLSQSSRLKELNMKTKVAESGKNFGCEAKIRVNLK